MVAERALPTPPLQPSPSAYSFPSPTKRDPALKPNPHPYAIKTTTSALLTRSNSSGYNVGATHHSYIPISPNARRSPEHSKGHRSTKSQPVQMSPSHSSPRPLPVPPTFPSSSPTRSANGSCVSADEAFSSRRSKRADTLPSFSTPDVSVHTTGTFDDLPPNPKLWTPAQLSSYLITALRVASATHSGGSDYVLPIPVAKDIAAFLRSRMVSGRTFLRLSDEDLQSMGMNKKWCQVLLAASHDLRQNVLKGRIWGTDASPSSSPGSVSPAIPMDVFSNGMYASSAPDLLADEGGSESEESPKRYRNGRVRGMVESFERSGSFSSESSFDADNEGSKLRRTRSNLGRWLREEGPIDEDPLRSPSPVRRVIEEPAEPTVAELLAADPADSHLRRSWGVRAWEEMDLQPGVTVKRITENDTGNGTWVPADQDAIKTIVTLENGSGKGSSHRKGSDQRRVTAIFAPSYSATTHIATERETKDVAIGEAVSLLEMCEAGAQADSVEPPSEADWIVRENILIGELATTRALLEAFRARLEVVEQKVAELEQREHEREMHVSQEVETHGVSRNVSSDVAVTTSTSVPTDENMNSPSFLDQTTALLPVALQHLNRSLPMAIGFPSAPKDDDNEEPSSITDLTSYVLMVGLGVCAVVFRVVLRKVTGRGVGLKP